VARTRRGARARVRRWERPRPLPGPDHPRPFVEHLEELRGRLIKSLIAVLIASSAAMYATDPVIRFLARTSGGFVFLRPTEAIFTRIKIALALGLLITLPFVLFQAWRFVTDALAPGARRALKWTIPVSYVLFLAGCAFGFFVLVPIGAKYLLACGNEVMKPLISVDSYVGFTGMICLALGVIFQLPLVSFFASRLGILDPALLSRNRRIAILATYILCALLTPGPDPFTAIMLFIPTYLLYEASILTAKLARR